MTWICIRTPTRREREVVSQLRVKGVTAYAPLEVRKVEVRRMNRRWHEPRTFALMPGYVFCFVTGPEDIDTIYDLRPKPLIMADAYGKPKRVDVAKLRGLFLAEAFRCFDASYEPEKPKGYVRKFKPGDRVKGRPGTLTADWIGKVIGHGRDRSIEVMFERAVRPMMVSEDAVRELEAA